MNCTFTAYTHDQYYCLGCLTVLSCSRSRMLYAHLELLRTSITECAHLIVPRVRWKSPTTSGRTNEADHTTTL